MATQTGSIDLKAAMEAHDSAAQTSTKYITDFGDDGIKVHPEGERLNFNQIGASESSIYHDGVSVASYGEQARIGKLSSGHMVVSSDGLDYLQGDVSVFNVAPQGDKSYLIKESFYTATIAAGSYIQKSYTTGDITGAYTSAYEINTVYKSGDVYVEPTYANTPGSNAVYASKNVAIATDDNGVKIGESVSIVVWNRTSEAIEFQIAGTVDARSVKVRIGKEYVEGATDNESHMELDYHSMQLVDKEGETYFHVSDLRGADGLVEIVDEFVGNGATMSFRLSLDASSTDYTVSVSDSSGGTVTKYTNSVSFQSAPTSGATITVGYASASSEAKAYTLGTRDSSGNIGAYSLAEGRDNIASGLYSHAEGVSTTASGLYSHAEGYGTTASHSYSHAEGYNTTASHAGCHAEGSSTTASGLYSHAEGNGTTTSGEYSHAEGFLTRASGTDSHAEGAYTTASGSESHAQNFRTIAASSYQTAIGKYNVSDTNDEYALIIGNGTGDANRSNAFAVTWDGDVETPGGSITPVILYDDDTTALNVPINLSETAANFRRLTICYKTNDDEYSSVEVWHPDGKLVSLTATRTAGNSTASTVWLKSKTVLISGTTINTAYSTSSGTNYYFTSQTRADGNYAAVHGDYIAVTQVIGYR